VKSPCIAIDVSKASSYIQGFVKIGESISKAIKIKHDKEGYQTIGELTNEIKAKYGDVTCIFESTGIYHRSLQQFLELANQKYIILNPLEAAKIRKSSLRSTKTDKKDCESIAKAYFLNDYRYYKKQDIYYEQLQIMNRYYNFLIKQLRMTKINFRNQLDIIYPKFDELYDNPYLAVPMAILSKYPHPELIRKVRLTSIGKHLMKKTKHRERYTTLEAKKIKEYCINTQSGCFKESIEVRILENLIKSIEAKQNNLNEHIKLMKKSSMNNPFYHQLLTIPGIGENLAVRLIGELGDISRFDTKRQLVAYAGVDPIVYQSGKMTGEHLHITKKGNKNLRCLLYLAVSANIRMGKLNPIRNFYNKKKQQDNPLSHKAALIACVNKLLRIIYSMNESGELFHY